MNIGKIIIIAHSYGTRLAIRLASQIHIDALIQIAPKSHSSENETKQIVKLTGYSDYFLDCLRFMDRYSILLIFITSRIGGLYSTSVKRMLSSSASVDQRKQQLEWNKASSSRIIKNYLCGVITRKLII